MRPESPQPLLPERLRMPLRVASVLVGYVLYRVIEGPIVGRLLMAAGFVALDWAVIDKLTTWRKEQSSMILVGQGLLGIGLMVAGAVVAFA